MAEDASHLAGVINFTLAILMAYTGPKFVRLGHYKVAAVYFVCMVINLYLSAKNL